MRKENDQSMLDAHFNCSIDNDNNNIEIKIKSNKKKKEQISSSSSSDAQSFAQNQHLCFIKYFHDNNTSSNNNSFSKF